MQGYLLVLLDSKWECNIDEYFESTCYSSRAVDVLVEIRHDKDYLWNLKKLWLLFKLKVKDLALSVEMLFSATEFRVQL